jgi:hypothetical protein
MTLPPGEYTPEQISEERYGLPYKPHKGSVPLSSFAAPEARKPPVGPDHWTVETVKHVKVTHDATGKTAEAATEDEAFGRLVRELIASGDITINAGRSALGMPPYQFPGTILCGDGYAGTVIINNTAEPEPVASPEERAAANLGIPADEPMTREQLDRFREELDRLNRITDRLVRDAAGPDPLTIRLPGEMGNGINEQVRTLNGEWREIFTGLQAQIAEMYSQPNRRATVLFRLTPKD